MNFTPKSIASAVGLIALICAGASVDFCAQSVRDKNKPHIVTFEEVGRVKPGMTAARVQDIFVSPAWSPTPAPGSTVSEMQWLNRDYSGMSVWFQNGRVINATRIGALPQENTGE